MSDGDNSNSNPGGVNPVSGPTGVVVSRPNVGGGGSDMLRERMARMAAGRGRGRGGGSSPWDSLVGMPGEEAARRIRADDPMLHVHILPEGSMATADYRLDRVRVYVNREGNVSRTPRVG